MKRVRIKKLLSTLAAMLMIGILLPLTVHGQEAATVDELAAAEISFSIQSRNDTIFVSGEMTPENKVEYGNGEINISFDMTQYGVSPGSVDDFIKLTRQKSVLAISEGFKTIREGAFYRFSIIAVLIPASVTEIDERAFYSCDDIVAYSVDAGNKNYSSVDGLLYDRDKTVLLSCPNGKEGKCTIPESVVEIKKRAIFNCTLSDLFVQWKNPPTADSNVFGVGKCKIGKLHIPPGTKKAYNAAGWTKYFKKVVEEK
ncbi:MAG: leucine-rich repeat domain-containing protein [Prevotellaceae bacterium]|jgi:hypothetical protein|nr:leucine-rich repeat domain-containing protein [Prevotellaceae bacterium]